MENTKKIWPILALIVTLGVVIYFWYIQSFSMLFQDKASIFISLARITALVGTYSVLLQLILIGRLSWIERIYGHDKLSIFHHINGFFAWFLILLHGLFVTFGYALLGKISFLSQISQFTNTYDDVIGAIAGLVFLSLVIITSLWIVQRKMRYEYWFLVHLLTYIAILVSFGHQLELGGDFGNKIFVGYWYLLYTFVIINLVWFRVIIPLYNSYKYQFEISKIKRENDRTISLYIKGKNLDSFKRKPGQFVILRVLNKNLWWEAHPYSISNIDNKEIRITAREIGDFSHKLKDIKNGTKLILEGPYGIFTQTQEKRFLFIAGGIGITPIRAILESLSKDKNSTLLYSNSTKTHITFKSELEKIRKNKKLKINYIVTSDKSWKGEKRKIDLKVIKEYCPDFKNREIYICGPKVFMKEIVKHLLNSGIPKKQIHYEKFSLG